jgi:5-methylcytosine-specific restriction endonuclease McrA
MDKEKCNARNRKYYQKHKEKILKNSIIYRNENREYINKRQKIYDKNNKAKRCAKQAKYKAAKLNATPNWLTKYQLIEIEQIYIDTKECQWLSEEQLQVDHIVPLQGKEVCGLHVPWNLQVLTATQNRIKSNNLKE